MPRAVIFDLDGTFVDTIADIAGALNRALSRHGLPARGVDEVRLMVGEGLAELVAKAAPGLSGAAFESLKADAGAALAENLIVRTRPFPGVEGLLDGLGARGLPVAILSNKPHGLALRTVEAIFPGRDFALVRGESPDFPRKPHPAAALDIASRLGLEPAALAFVGDSATDMRTAVNAGMEAIGVAWGYRDREELLAAGARRVAADCAELLALLA